MTRLRHRLLIAALRALPQHVLSRLAGRVATWRLPSRLQQLEIRAFARAVGVDFSEVHDPIDSFLCLQDFFTRALAPGARPIDPEADAVVAPCDGFWGASGVVERGTLLQLKGRPYALARLLGDTEQATRLEGGVYATFYLSPRDYHRFHAPCAAHVLGAVHLPGSLWPVNEAGLEGVDSLFAENERICATMRTASGGMLCMVAVGATLVGKVRLAFDDLTTNVRGAASARRDYPPPGHPLAKGQEWGRFEFGSTIVMIAAPGVIRLDGAPPGTPLRLGRRIGSLLDGS
jgi:phosphatidylserine decarboxylase